MRAFARPVTVFVTTAIATLLFLGPLRAASGADLVAPYAATPDIIVDEMLRLARVGPDDYVVDLGSGDGRMVIAAVKRFNARGALGVDLDASLVTYARNRASADGVAGRARFEVQDLFTTDLKDATVVTVYLLPGAMRRLEAKLRAELQPGTRIVSHDYAFVTWPVDRVMTYDVPEKTDYTGRRQTALYLYSVPAKAAAPPRRTE
jgi:ubiquinone/menaquinone biosynthesis C-methylase UbiE